MLSEFSPVLQLLKMRVVVPKYLRHKETMIYFHYFATKTRLIYFYHFPENFVLILNNFENIAKNISVTL